MKSQSKESQSKEDEVFQNLEMKIVVKKYANTCSGARKICKDS